MVSSLAEHPVKAKQSKTRRTKIAGEIRCLSELPTTGFGDRLGVSRSEIRRRQARKRSVPVQDACRRLHSDSQIVTRQVVGLVPVSELLDKPMPSGMNTQDSRAHRAHSP